MSWLLNADIQSTPDLRNIERLAERHCYIETYRSRLNIDTEYIINAFSWYWLPKTVHTNTGTEVVSRRGAKLRYYTHALTRGETDSTVNNALTRIHDATQRTTPERVYVELFNSINNSEAANILNERLHNGEIGNAFTELQVRPIVTQNVNHKITVYWSEFSNTMVVITNVYNEQLVYAISAVLLQAYMIEDDDAYKQALSAAYLAGDKQAVIGAIGNRFDTARQEQADKRFNNALNELSNIASQTDLQQYQDKIKYYRNEIDSYLNSINSLRVAIKEQEALWLAAITTDDTEEINYLREFLTSNRKNIAYLDVTNSWIDIVYNIPLCYWDEDAFNMIRNTTHDNPYTRAPEPTRKLLDKILKTREIKLIMWSGTRLYIDECAVKYLSQTNVPDTVVTGLYNPHHYHYDCYGDYKSSIANALGEKKFVDALMLTQAAVAGINMSDGPVFKKFVEDMTLEYSYAANTPCLQIVETGEVVSLKEYYRKETENETNQTNE